MKGAVPLRGGFSDMQQRKMAAAGRVDAFVARAGRVRMLGLCLFVGLAVGTVVAPSAWATSGALAWGDNSLGQLCNGTTKTARVPTTVVGINEVKQVAAGSDFSLFLLANGTVDACGAGGSGQLGDGKNVGSEEPVPVKGLTKVVAIAAGGSHALALTEGGSVYAWGAGEWGQLGNGKTENHDEPVLIEGLTEVAAVAAGKAFSLALKGGTVYAWGANGFGQLGDGNSTGPEKCRVTEEKEGHVVFLEEQNCSKTPTHETGLTEVTAIAAGGQHALALLEGGTVKAWGANGVGQLGDGTKTGPETCTITIEKEGKPANEEEPCSRKPVTVSGLSEVTAIAGGDLHSLAIVSGGKVKAWGAGGSGQLGNGKEETSDTAVEVAKIKEVTAIAGGGFFSLALLKNGTVDAWGENSSGQLGNETLKNSLEPEPVDDLSEGEATCIAAGTFFSLSCGAHGPQVLTLTPNKGELTGGTHVDIKGHFLTHVTEVLFAANPATGLKEISPEEIEVTTPAGKKLTSVSVTVMTTHGVTPNGTGTPKFTYIPSPLIELGRCSKVTPGTGKYNDAACTEASSSGSYEWHGGVGSLPKFSASGGSVTLENTAGTKMKCTKANESGEYTGTEAVTNVGLTLTGCALGGAKCTSSGKKEGEVVSATLEGTLGWQERPTNEVALDLASKSANMIEAACGASTLKVAGSVIGAITPINEMSTTFKVDYKATKGKQSIEHFEGKTNDVLEMTVGSEAGKQAGLTLDLTQSNEESIEINTIF
jgi:alpha-tubulin suppressor-like RCC1 family protein